MADKYVLRQIGEPVSESLSRSFLSIYEIDVPQKVRIAVVLYV